MRHRTQAPALLAAWGLLLALAGVASVAAQDCQAVSAEFVLTGLSAADGNSRNHEVGVCLPHFTLELTEGCKLTIKPLYANNAYISMLQVGENQPGDPIVPRASDGVALVNEAVTNRMGYYYLKPQRCPQVYQMMVKGQKLLASDVATLLQKTLEVDSSILSAVMFTQYGLSIAWKTRGQTANELSYTAISKAGGQTMPDFQAFGGSTNNFCPLLDINSAFDFDVNPQDGIVDAETATLVGRVPREIPGKPGFFVCAIAPAGGYVKARRNAGFANTAVQYAYTVESPNTYVTCGAGGSLYKLGAVNAGGDMTSDVCVACLRGSYATAGATLCSPCAVGEYQDQMGQKTCFKCQYGYAPYEGAQRCMNCYYGRAYCSEGYSPNEAAYTCNSARLPAGYSPEAGFAVVRPMTDPTNIDNAMSYSRMFNSCSVTAANSLLGFNVSAECRVDMYVLGDLGINGNLCSQNAQANSITAYYTAPNLLAGLFTKGIGPSRVGLFGLLGPGGFSTTFFANSMKAALGPDRLLPTQTILGLTYTGWGYLGGGDNGLGQNAGVRGVAADPCPPGTHKQMLNGDGVANPGEDPNLLLSDYCVPCGPGVFCDSSAPAPQNCPAGTYGGVIGAKSTDGCIDCPIGTFQNMDGQFECQVCAVNTFASAPGATTCTSCGDGYEVAVSGSNMCNPCQPGFYRDSAISDTCQECPPGTSSGEAAGQCNVCLPGSFAPAAKSAACTECPRGTYQPKYGAQECIPCKQGSYQDSRGGAKCKVCPAGTFNPDTNAVSAMSCKQCPMGTAGVKPGADKCKECNPGHYTNRNGQTSCTPCATGFFIAKKGAERCKPCPKGTFTEKGAAQKCTKCPIGFFAAFEGASRCQSCPAGSFTNATGASSCAQCPAGSYSTRTGADSAITCVECPAGSFSYQPGSTECQLCPAGQYTEKTGRQACRNCPLGTYSTDEGSNRCLPCKSGFTTASIGSDSADACSIKIQLDGVAAAPGAS